METQADVAHEEAPNERRNAVAMTVFSVLILTAAVIGTGTDFAAGIWVTLCAAMLAMAATFEGIEYGHWRRGAAIFTAGIALAALSVELFSDDKTMIYKTIAAILLATGVVMMGLGMRRCLREGSAASAVIPGMFLTALVTVAMVLLALVLRIMSSHTATFVITVCCVAFSAIVTVTALRYAPRAGGEAGWPAKAN